MTDEQANTMIGSYLFTANILSALVFTLRSYGVKEDHLQHMLKMIDENNERFIPGDDAKRLASAAMQMVYSTTVSTGASPDQPETPD